ncbi:hypothetical protein ACKI1I_09790 [Streptomyces turgidiscabies]|uniref:Tat pathway signal sequence domain protein n=1 Tax=Streptomyces turgidiscabies (strain Car8) TaxID=698760 RepID=L7EX36_STRT8|nr:hypothetical protein [Streptomyces turgidiscabies]ELP63978.1 hypothetical protein STRTUCAR8_02880 [Streptomyces turgidiscabies Car8]MDX3497388.1 hypothetical protein [Streptomyces turgidiscabies]GAQ72321.1 hypothetical protein T45_04069 [Streptomyces turgidiscabies]
MTGIGPVEPVNSPDAQETYEVIGADTPRLAERWQALSPRARRAAVGAAALGATAAAVIALLPPEPSAPARTLVAMPWPADVTTFRYTGLAATFDSAPANGLFRFAVTVHSGPPVTVRVIGTGLDGLAARISPAETSTVDAGTTRRITVQISVVDCAVHPLDADLPFLDVTLRNTRAIQHHRFAFAATYPDDLSQLVRAACSPLPARPSPRATGSADSQNVDYGQFRPNAPRPHSPKPYQPARHNKKVTSQPTEMPPPMDRA